MKNYKTLSISLLGILFLLGSCAPSTDITATWNNPDVEDDALGNILVTAMVDDVSARQNLEDELARELMERGISVTKSINLFPPSMRNEKMQDKEALLNAIEENNFDGVITVALIDKETDTRYIPGNYAYSPVNTYGYYGNFWGYYNNWYPQVYNTGYYDVDKEYFLETNLYNAESEKLVWSAQSQTVNPETLENLTEDYSEKIVRYMENESLVGKASTTP
ncbi:hypothetical protein GCM10011506_32700 [Marivirga lumbricoides]|uniref:DUF4136 domain-containing protein n=1 Tax=Marivirga lumbricoides TaxID=1046115 RepID=A0ABQ1MRC4_9BACT|nr:hypothetical protein GCM10011506_32700 [Marivirga lumbricoides]